MLLIRAILTVLVTAFLVGITSTGQAQGEKAITNAQLVQEYRIASQRGLALADSMKHPCLSARKAIVFYRSITWSNQDSLHETRRSTRYPERTKGQCAYKRYLVHVWKSEAVRYTQLMHSFVVDSKAAICYVFGSYCSQAIAVTWCESRHSTRAENGQYLGLFQMGSSERGIFGHGSTAIQQSFAAHRYFVASGRDWSPWSCKPW